MMKIRRFIVEEGQPIRLHAGMILLKAEESEGNLVLDVVENSATAYVDCTFKLLEVGDTVPPGFFSFTGGQAFSLGDKYLFVKTDPVHIQGVVLTSTEG